MGILSLGHSAEEEEMSYFHSIRHFIIYICIFANSQHTNLCIAACPDPLINHTQVIQMDYQLLNQPHMEYQLLDQPLQPDKVSIASLG